MWTGPSWHETKASNWWKLFIIVLRSLENVSVKMGWHTYIIFKDKTGRSRIEKYLKYSMKIDLGIRINQYCLYQTLLLNKEINNLWRIKVSDYIVDEISSSKVKSILVWSEFASSVGSRATCVDYADYRRKYWLFWTSDICYKRLALKKNVKYGENVCYKYTWLDFYQFLQILNIYLQGICNVWLQST